MSTAPNPAEFQPAGPDGAVPDLVPVRMLNEFAYCPRLAWLEWVQGDFADNPDTVDGRRVHSRVDKESGDLPAPAELEQAIDPERPVTARSVYLSAPKLGLVAKLDLVEGQGLDVTPVDYKRGQVPDTPEGTWEPERVQVCAQAMILEENGYRCASGVVYYAGSRRRVTVPITPELRQRTVELLAAMRRTMGRSMVPAPLEDSPKCPRCSLVGICLPDEVNLLRIRRPPRRVGPGVEATAEQSGTEPSEPRRLLAARDDALPLYVQANGARIGKSGDELVVTPREGPKTTARLGQTSQIALFGNVQMSTQAIQAAVGHGIPITYYSFGGWFYGVTTGMMHKNVELRRLQFRTAEDRDASLALARRFVASKIRNCRTLLRRNAEDVPQQALDDLRRFADDALGCGALDSLLGTEGSAARVYFQSFSRMLKLGPEDALAFDFEGRNRRPPRDPVNALLSLAYSLLAKDLTITCQVVGFDPYMGFYHQPRYGRPALALDLMEEFRPLVADSVVINAINTGVVRPDDFGGRGGAVFLTDAGRARFLRAYERRMDELVTHPVFGYRVSYRRVLEVQVRLLARFLGGEIPEYPGFQTR